MSYVDQKTGPSAAGLASSIIVQAAIGVAIVAGLSVSGVIAEKKDGPLIGIELPDDPPPPPPPPPETREATPDTPSSTPVFTPPTRIELDIPGPTIEVTDKLPPVTLPNPRVTPQADPSPPAPVATFAPVAAKPRNNPGGWLRDRDYKSSWVRREYQGVAGFRLDISATGTVTGCRVTSTTGHAELDEATCSLIRERARFEPARGTSGEPVAGSFSSSVAWVLPD